MLPRAPRSIQWEFPKARLQIREVFGQGAFGQVAKGLAFQIAGKANWTVVAVKMLKGWRVHNASISWEILRTYCLSGRDGGVHKSASKIGYLLLQADPTR